MITLRNFATGIAIIMMSRKPANAAELSGRHDGWTESHDALTTTTASNTVASTTVASMTTESLTATTPTSASIIASVPVSTDYAVFTAPLDIQVSAPAMEINNSMTYTTDGASVVSSSSTLAPEPTTPTTSDANGFSVANIIPILALWAVAMSCI